VFRIETQRCTAFRPAPWLELFARHPRPAKSPWRRPQRVARAGGTGVSVEVVDELGSGIGGVVEMTDKSIPSRLTTEKLNELISRYDRDYLVISRTYRDGGIEPLWPRFNRAALNQMNDGLSTFSRYAIWANTVRDNIIEAITRMNTGDGAGAQQLLIRASNSLSAFADVQAYFDSNRRGTNNE
jgi:hypothetical protein